MSFWRWLFGSPDHNPSTHDFPDASADSAGVVNPATGLPMLNGDMSGIDAGGNLYGMDDHHPSHDSGSSWDSSSSGSDWATWD